MGCAVYSFVYVKNVIVGTVLIQVLSLCRWDAWLVLVYVSNVNNYGTVLLCVGVANMQSVKLDKEGDCRVCVCVCVCVCV